MSERLVHMLKSLRDVEGVVGSFVWGKAGQVLARDLPENLEQAILEEVGPRIERIYEAFQGAGDELDVATLVFAQHKLHLREFDPAFIAVLSQPRVNAPALKMAVHLVGRNVCAELERIKTAPPPPSHMAPATAPASAAGSKAPPRQSRMRFWRGSRIPD